MPSVQLVWEPWARQLRFGKATPQGFQARSKQFGHTYFRMLLIKQPYAFQVPHQHLTGAWQRVGDITPKVIAVRIIIARVRYTLLETSELSSSDIAVSPRSQSVRVVCEINIVSCY